MVALRVFVLALAFIALPAAAGRAGVQIVNYDNVSVVNAQGRAATAEQIRKAFDFAAVGRGWQITHTGPSSMVASYNKQGKHQVSTDITYAHGTFSLKYRDSVNMRYEPAGEGQGLIHPHYNKWVQFLVDDARAALIRP
jgi:hypothetical protein